MYTTNMFIQKAYANGITPPSNITSIADILNEVLPIVYGVAGIAMFGYLIYAGFTWLLSAGDPDKLRKAQDTMLNAVIGLAIVVFAYFGTRVIGGILGLPLLS
jgi:hypothetical protein